MEQTPDLVPQAAAAAQAAAPAAQGLESKKVLCERIKEEMKIEFSKEKPRLLGPTGLGGLGVTTMMDAYLTKWGLLTADEIDECTHSMKTRADQAKTLLRLLRTASAKHLIMFARILQELNMTHQLDCLGKKENAWIFEGEDQDAYNILSEIYPTETE